MPNSPNSECWYVLINVDHLMQRDTWKLQVLDIAEKHVRLNTVATRCNYESFANFAAWVFFGNYMRKWRLNKSCNGCFCYLGSLTRRPVRLTKSWDWRVRTNGYSFEVWNRLYPCSTNWTFVAAPVTTSSEVMCRPPSLCRTQEPAPRYAVNAGPFPVGSQVWRWIWWHLNEL